MSTESSIARAVRMSDADWNELLVTAINAGYKNRTEYIRAALKGSKLWYSEQLPDDASNNTARILARAEAAEAKAAQLQAELQAATLPIMENPQSLKHQLDTANARITELNSLIHSVTENKPIRGFKEIVADMPEKVHSKWDAEKWKAETWVKYFLDNK